MPIPAKIRNGSRQPSDDMPISATTSTGVIAAAEREPACVVPCAIARSDGNIQRDSARLAIGKDPASPMPIRNRKTPIDTADQDRVVSAVNADHQITTQVSAARGPTRSPNQPPGIWNSA